MVPGSVDVLELAAQVHDCATDKRHSAARWILQRDPVEPNGFVPNLSEALAQ
jgi:hypothetical protein